MSGKLAIRRLGYALGAEVRGVDLTQPLSDSVAAELRKAWLDHIVLCFPGQNLDPQQLRRFAGAFGEVEEDDASLGRLPNGQGVTILSNKPVTIDNRQIGGDGQAIRWHSDHSFRERPMTATFLNAKELPEIGGDTLFASGYLAYETLSPAFQRLIENLELVHDVTLRGGYLTAKRTPEEKERFRTLNPPVRQSVVRTHPETGRKTLFVGDAVRNFAGMTEEESKPLVDFLNAHATRYEFTYRHRWSNHDLVMWDNRCALHKAVLDYDQTQMRRMIRCSCTGPKTGDIYVPQPALAGTPG